MPVMTAKADKVDKLTAICVVCGEPATDSAPGEGKPARYDEPIVVVGAAEMYEAAAAATAFRRSKYLCHSHTRNTWTRFIRKINYRLAFANLQPKSTDYAGKELLVICILRGGVMFLTDLIRHIDVPLAIEFMAVSSYGAGARSSQGDVRITLDLNTTIYGKHVIIVEDIIDSGHTLSSVIDLLKTAIQLRSILHAVDKYERRKWKCPSVIAGSKSKRVRFGYGN